MGSHHQMPPGFHHKSIGIPSNPELEKDINWDRIQLWILETNFGKKTVELNHIQKNLLKISTWFFSMIICWLPEKAPRNSRFFEVFDPILQPFPKRGQLIWEVSTVGWFLWGGWWLDVVSFNVLMKFLYLKKDSCFLGVLLEKNFKISMLVFLFFTPSQKNQSGGNNSNRLEFMFSTGWLNNRPKHAIMER